MDIRRSLRWIDTIIRHTFIFVFSTRQSIGHRPIKGNSLIDFHGTLISLDPLICRILDRAGRSLIRRLLERDRTRRLGCMVGGVNDIKEHRWFEQISWTDVIEQRTSVSEEISAPLPVHCFFSRRFDLKWIIQVIHRTSNYSKKSSSKPRFVHRRTSIYFTSSEKHFGLILLYFSRSALKRETEKICRSFPFSYDLSESSDHRCSSNSHSKHIPS